MLESLAALIQAHALWIACGIFAALAALVAIQLLAERMALKILQDEMGSGDGGPSTATTQRRYLA